MTPEGIVLVVSGVAAAIALIVHAVAAAIVLVKRGKDEDK